MSSLEFKTIAAVATPTGYGGIGIIRISGDQALQLTLQLLKNSGEVSFTPSEASFHILTNPNTNVTIDEAIITYFKAPHSFTGEDVVEIACHGSPVVLSELLKLLTSFGADLAQPGEFSMRAFLNRRIDLTQAEAINDLIHSQTTYQAKVAARQLRGELSKQLQPYKEELKSLIVHFESAVEFVEDDLDALNLNFYTLKIDHLIEKLLGLSESYRIGRVIRSGVKLALIGRPNVGKSSVFNSLLGLDRAIVTHVPGTTRDTLSETFSINGIPINLIDTAGIRDTKDIVERIGVERTKTAITEADMVIAVIEANSPITSEEIDQLEQFPIGILLINKCDLGVTLPQEITKHLSAKYPVIQASALTGQGIDELKVAIQKKITSDNQTIIESAIITNERHYTALEQTIEALREARTDLNAGFTEEVALANLHRALRSLGVITGETLIADLINQIFSTFCIGK
ncbi:MAG: tRNA uridine-5-carboxymethylaminomethyl(34) synthesis GTPase MnmE [Acidobacteria bacterium]|nr:tRNA uridine-5-carboxymethylaminomethyl(34) synthesis GTPase MnmE [Acidobacteriota bacterium]